MNRSKANPDLTENAIDSVPIACACFKFSSKYNRQQSLYSSTQRVYATDEVWCGTYCAVSQCTEAGSSSLLWFVLGWCVNLA